jgi:hypothetical protein
MPRITDIIAKTLGGEVVQRPGDVPLIRVPDTETVTVGSTTIRYKANFKGFAHISTDRDGETKTVSVPGEELREIVHRIIERTREANESDEG